MDRPAPPDRLASGGRRLASAWGREMRAVWIASHHHSGAWQSPDALARALDQLRALGWNTLFPAVWNRGLTAWPSTAMKRLGLPAQDPFFAEAGWDPLAVVAELGRERGLTVIPWLEYGFACEPVGSPGRLLDARPEWAARDRRGRVVEHGGLRWLNALNPAVRDFLAALVLEVVDRYGVRGVQGDDHIALPLQGSHDPSTLARYEQATGHPVPRWDGHPRWNRFRQEEISRWVRELGARIHATRPELLWSLSPCPLPRGRRQLMQDSGVWMAEGQVDLLVPQFYRATVGAFHQVVRHTLRALPAERRHQVVAGLALRVHGRELEADTLRRMVLLSRQEELGGVAVFHHDLVGAREAASWEWIWA